LQSRWPCGGGVVDSGGFGPTHQQSIERPSRENPIPTFTYKYTMGDTISSLLFQPPPPSKLKKHKVVWLTTSKGHRIPGFYISYKKHSPLSYQSQQSHNNHSSQHEHTPPQELCKSLSAHEIAHSQPEAGITILYSHANAEDLGSIYPWCKFLSKMLQVNLFAYDYSGYGMAIGDGK
jgi:abhydrolase domain-containing protein 17